MQSMVAQFSSWLQQQDPVDTVDPTDVEDCIVHKFLKSQGYPVYRVGVFWWVDIYDRRHPIPYSIAELISECCDWASLPYAQVQQIWGTLK